MKKNSVKLLIICLLCLSCNKLEDIKINEKCLDDKPSFGSIYVNVTISNEIKSVPIEIRLNNFNTGELILRDTIYENEKVYDVDINNYYVVSAEYKKGNITTTSIDGGKVSTRKISHEDGSECWNLRNLRARVYLN